MRTRIPGLKQYQGRNPKGYFQDLDWPVRQRAYYWLGVFCKRWGRNLPLWRLAILVGQAKRLAKNPPTSAWGRSKLASEATRQFSGGIATKAGMRPRKPPMNVSEQFLLAATAQSMKRLVKFLTQRSTLAEGRAC